MLWLRCFSALDETKMSTDKPTPATGSVPLPKMRKGLKGFWRETMREMKHVHWPNKSETNRLTGVVLAVCFLSVSFLFVLSVVFDTIFRQLFRGGA